MGQREKLIIKILGGAQDNNIPFDDACNLLSHFGFEKRFKGSHRIFYKDGVEDILNLQPKNGKVKPYQVKQIRKIMIELERDTNE
jgi:predicted RNA binding protein YcfA (HicA-like mRNA interferase family)